MPRRRLGLLYACLAPLCWGSAVPVSKAVLGGLPPVLFLTLALAVSCLAFWAVALWQRLPRNQWRAALRSSWLGLLEPGLAYLFGVFGLAETDAGAASLIGASESIMVVGLAALLFKERVSRRFLLLALVAFAGLWAVIGLPTAGLSTAAMTGDALYAVGALVAALYVVLSARVVTTQNLVLVLAGQQTAALILTLAALVLTGLPTGLGPIPLTTWGLTGLDGLLQALAFLFFFQATERVGTSLPSVFLNLTPVTGLAGATLALGESLSLAQGIGASLTLAALIGLSLL